MSLRDNDYPAETDFHRKLRNSCNFRVIILHETSVLAQVRTLGKINRIKYSCWISFHQITNQVVIGGLQIILVKIFVLHKMVPQIFIARVIEHTFQINFPFLYHRFNERIFNNTVQFYSEITVVPATISDRTISCWKYIIICVFEINIIIY
jgi:hypothetical protein